MRKSTQLPRTSRVSEKIIEYYQKFGQERDLEKYMRIYSPQSDCRSRSRTTTISSSGQSEDEGRIFRQLFQHEIVLTAESDTDAKEILIPIDVQKEKMPSSGMKPKGDECTSSAPDLHTPPPRIQRPTDTKETQTPESIAKSHRRLEWDSLADVGYRKSLSTSNISILERSVLKEYFQEISSTSGAKKEKIFTNDKNKTNYKTESSKEVNKSKPTTKDAQINQNTPPLASSTMMDPRSVKENIPIGSRPKLVSKSTSMSLQKRYDQSVQTSIQRLPQVASREVQVALSSATSVTSSNAASTATPSSFYYYSSRSNNSTTTDAEIGNKKLSLNKGPATIMKSKERQKHIHPFVAGINEMLLTHKVMDSKKGDSTKNDGNTRNLQQVHDTLKQAFNENKENTTECSTLLNSPQLDLGIQLLCSLIDARSLSRRQKRKLVRDIVKRISTLNTEGEPAISSIDTMSAQLTDTKVDQPNIEASVKTTSTVKVARIAKSSMDMSDLARDLPASNSSEAVAEQLLQVDVFKKPSLPTTSAQAAAKLAAEKAMKSPQRKPERIRAGTQTENGDGPKLANIAEANIKRKGANLERPKIANNLLDTDKDSTASKASTTNSNEVMTQKAALNIENVGASDTDLDIAAHSTMREWLNPMTQSEIDYEEKKSEFARNATKREKLEKCLDDESLDTERKTQLKWIQAEIERLEMLRCLLIKTNTQRNNEADVRQKINNFPNAQEMENIYDTVFSEGKRVSVINSTTTTSGAHSTSSSCRDDKHLQEIEVIIEESNEDVVELDEKIKRTKQRKKETQIIYDKPNEAQNNYDNIAAGGQARFRTMTEVITTNEEQILPTEGNTPPEPIQTTPAPPKKLPAETERRQQQRSKIDTPSGDSNDDDRGGAESVGSFAKQRKREFLEQYRNKKRLHYESLLHQQQQFLIQQQQRIIQELQQRCNAIGRESAVGAVVGGGHYSIPHNMPHTNYCGCANSQQQPYHQTYFQPHGNPHPHAPPCPPCPPCPPRPHRAQTHTAARAATAATAANYMHKTQTIHSEQSTSSIFCISSEVSIPMGSTSTSGSGTISTTTTTTHQYDDVAAVNTGVGVQTGASLRRTQPIFGRRILYDCSHHRGGRNVQQWATYNPQPVSSGQSISVQVKPKAIAYVIQFDKKTTTSSTTITNTTTETSSSNSIAKVGKKANDDDEDEMKGDMRDKVPKPCALQDYLERARPQFVAHTKERKAILNQIQALRLERGKELREIIENASENSMDMHLQNLPPPATKQLRVFATKEMKAMTQRHFENLPEVIKQQERAREERRRLGNRMIRDIFNQRLQRRVRTGKLSLNHSKTVI